MRIMCTRQNLQQYGDTWWNEGLVVRGEKSGLGVEAEIKINVDVCASWVWPTRSSLMSKRSKFRFNERFRSVSFMGGWVNPRSTSVS